MSITADYILELYAEKGIGEVQAYLDKLAALPKPKVTPSMIFGTSNAVDTVTDHKLTNCQTKAWAKINEWLLTEDSFFVLKGYAGTGKSFLMKMLLTLKGRNFLFSAPTNKAASVLSSFLGEQAKTTYSLLGLRMETEDDKKVLKVSALPDLGNKPILVIDEAGMIPAFMAKLLIEVCASKGWRVIFVGDPAQLSPVGESRSTVWGLASPNNRVLLKEVKRFDNQLLKLSIRIRQRIKNQDYRPPIKDDNDGTEGVFLMASQREMLAELSKLKLEDWKTNKITCWRNRTVDSYNIYIRKKLGFKAAYEPGEVILMASPLISQGNVIAYTDEEFQIKSITKRIFSFPEGEFEAKAIALEDKAFSLYVPENPGKLETFLAHRANLASQASGYERKTKWKSFWELKETFQNIRYGYAMTNHRLQGSTVQNIHVDQQDILANSDKLEAFRGLYVAATRPQLKLTTF